MKKEDIKNAFDNVEPNDIAKQRMLNKVLNHSNNVKEVSFMKLINKRTAIPVFAMTLVIAGSVMIYNLTQNNTIEGRLKGTDSTINRETEDMVAQIRNQFQIGDRHYTILYEENKAEFKFPNEISDKDIGDKITTITKTIDEDLKGLEVYKYLPAGSEAVVAVKKDNEYNLFRFYNFESYINNQDEDVSTYLNLYGINSSADIAKIQFIGYSEQAKVEGRINLISEITDREKIAEFYNYYSVIKNSSDKYFDSLFNYKSQHITTQTIVPQEIEVPPDYVDVSGNDSSQSNVNSHKVEYADDLLIKNTETMDTKSDTRIDIGQGAAMSGSTGVAGDALGNSITIRIYNQSGVYFDAIYYTNIGFISRHEVNDDFANFLKEYR